MLSRLNKIKTWQASLIIGVLGFASYYTGLFAPFEGDDMYQIVNNVPVHSITNIRLFFEGGTFYTGNGLAPLSGEYYRPLMSTVFSIIYSIFGPHPFYYHVIQLLFGIGSTIVLYLFFRFSFKPLISLVLSLIFLLHPIDSQTIYAIPSMQDALYFFFGILALWILVRFNSLKSLVPAVLCLALSVLAKESAVLFIGMAVMYLFWWNRRRLFSFIWMMVVPIVLYCIIRVHAVGVITNPYGGPIDRLNLASRLLTAPSIPVLYVSKLIFPWKLATGYYWVYRSFSIEHVLLPLLIDILLIGLTVFGARYVRNKSNVSMYYTYLFFAVWAFAGVLMLIQIVPLDMTACETWFYFPMAGILGMVGVVISTLRIQVSSQWLLMCAVIILLILGIRTAIRATDWRDPYTLALMDISNTANNYRADNLVANALVAQGNYVQAQPYAMNAIRIYPEYDDFINLAVIYSNEHNFAEAKAAYVCSLKYATPSTLQQTYDGLGSLTLFSDNLSSNQAYLENALKEYPSDSSLWLYLALLQARKNDMSDAKASITNAAKFGQIPITTYDNIMNDQPFEFIVAGETIYIP